jgi:hypothetical protein
MTATSLTTIGFDADDTLWRFPVGVNGQVSSTE